MASEENKNPTNEKKTVAVVKEEVTPEEELNSKNMTEEEAAEYIHSLEQQEFKRLFEELIAQQNGTDLEAMARFVEAEEMVNTEFDENAGAATNFEENVRELLGHEKFVEYGTISEDQPLEESDEEENLSEDSFFGGNSEMSKLMEAILADDIIKIKVLCEIDGEVNQVIDDLYCPLFLAVEENNIDIVRHLLLSGAEVNMEVGGQTVFHLVAASSGIISDMTNILRLLLSSDGFDLNMRDQAGRTPLHLCSDPSCVELLINASADVNARDIDGETSLFSASFLGEIKKMERLIEGGADINAANDSNQTPLWKAGCKGNLQAVKLLMEHGADSNIIIKEKNLLWHLAGFPTKFECWQLLGDQANADLTFHGPEEKSILFHALECNNYSVIMFLLQQETIDVNQVYEDETALMRAVGSTAPILELFLTHPNIDVSVTDEEGQNVLWYALNEGYHKGAAELLLLHHTEIPITERCIKKAKAKRYGKLANHLEKLLETQRNGVAI